VRVDRGACASMHARPTGVGAGAAGSASRHAGSRLADGWGRPPSGQRRRQQLARVACQPLLAGGWARPGAAVPAPQRRAAGTAPRSSPADAAGQRVGGRRTSQQSAGWGRAAVAAGSPAGGAPGPCLQVRTQTLVKNAIISIDATPFKQWYQQHYGVELGKKAVLAEGAEEAKVGASAEQGGPAGRGISGGRSGQRSTAQYSAAQQSTAQLLGRTLQSLGHATGRPLLLPSRGKAWPGAAAWDGWGRRLPERTPPPPAQKSNHVTRKLKQRTAGQKLDAALNSQFDTGRLFACISSRPGQCGRCDGYILVSSRRRRRRRRGRGTRGRLGRRLHVWQGKGVQAMPHVQAAAVVGGSWARGAAAPPRALARTPPAAGRPVPWVLKPAPPPPWGLVLRRRARSWSSTSARCSARRARLRHEQPDLARGVSPSRSSPPALKTVQPAWGWSACNVALLVGAAEW